MGHVIKYENKKGEITKDGHVMFPDDIAKELNRKSFLEHMRDSNVCVNDKCVDNRRGCSDHCYKYAYEFMFLCKNFQF